MTYIFLTHFIHYIFIIFIASCFPYFNLSMMQKIIFYTHYVNNLSVQYQYDIHSSCFEYFFKTNSTFSIFLSFFPFHQKIFPFLSPFLYNYSKELEIYYTFVLTEIVTRNSSPKNDSKWKFHSVVRWLKKKMGHVLSTYLHSNVHGNEFLHGSPCKSIARGFALPWWSRGSNLTSPRMSLCFIYGLVTICGYGNWMQ